MLAYLVGLALSASAPNQLTAIPLRCFAAFEEGDATYRECRRIVLMNALDEGARHRFSGDGCYGTVWRFGSKPEKEPSKELVEACDIEHALDQEVKVLHAIVDAKIEGKPRSRAARF